jgi:gamma-glutamylcyclotransferase (GGCT)/AIG2-like uncharacterized protein YtfP
MATRLFAYGTLRTGKAPAEIAATVSRLNLLGPAIARGQLHDLGEYPGAIFSASAGEIPGEVYEVPDASAWAAIDSYEGFYPEDHAASLFVRREIEVRVASTGETVLCWAYEYNRPL